MNSEVAEIDKDYRFVIEKITEKQQKIKKSIDGKTRVI